RLPSRTRPVRSLDYRLSRRSMYGVSNEARAHPVGCALAWSGRAETDSSARRLEPQHPTVGRVGEQVDEAVGSGADVTDAFAEALEKALLADRPAILE